MQALNSPKPASAVSIKVHVGGKGVEGSCPGAGSLPASTKLIPGVPARIANNMVPPAERMVCQDCNRKVGNAYVGFVVGHTKGRAA